MASDANKLKTTTNGRDVVVKGDDPFSTYGNAIRQTSIVGELLKFSKGDWMAGQNNDIIEDGTEFVANMDELFIGWVRWSNNRPTDHVMGKVIDKFQMPRRSELGDTDQNQWETDDRGEPRDPWQPTNYLLLEGEEEQLYTFTTSSRGGINAVGELCQKWGPIGRQRPKDYPVVAIGSGSYLHANKTFGRIKYPTFKIVGYAPKAEFATIEPRDDRGDEIVEELEIDTTAKPVKAPAKVVAAKAKEPARPTKGKARF